MSSARVVFDLADIDFISGAQLGTHDVPCVFCSGMKRAASRRRKVLRIWRLNPLFASYHCARCGESGYACDGRVLPVAGLTIGVIATLAWIGLLGYGLAKLL